MQFSKTMVILGALGSLALGCGQEGDSGQLSGASLSASSPSDLYLFPLNYRPETVAGVPVEQVEVSLVAHSDDLTLPEVKVGTGSISVDAGSKEYLESRGGTFSLSIEVLDGIDATGKSLQEVLDQKALTLMAGGSAVDQLQASFNDAIANQGSSSLTSLTRGVSSPPIECTDPVDCPCSYIVCQDPIPNGESGTTTSGSGPDAKPVPQQEVKILQVNSPDATPQIVVAGGVRITWGGSDKTVHWSPWLSAEGSGSVDPITGIMGLGLLGSALSFAKRRKKESV